MEQGSSAPQEVHPNLRRSSDRRTRRDRTGTGWLWRQAHGAVAGEKKEKAEQKQAREPLVSVEQISVGAASDLEHNKLGQHHQLQTEGSYCFIYSYERWESRFAENLLSSCQNLAQQQQSIMIDWKQNLPSCVTVTLLRLLDHARRMHPHVPKSVQQQQYLD